MVATCCQMAFLRVYRLPLSSIYPVVKERVSRHYEAVKTPCISVATLHGVSVHILSSVATLVNNFFLLAAKVFF